MAQTATVLCLHTRVKNTSGVAKTFSFLGARGKRLDVDEEYDIPGDLATRLQIKGSRHFKALERCLEDGRLTVVSTPAVILYDATDERSRQLAFDAGALGVVDPCYASEGSSDFVDLTS